MMSARWRWSVGIMGLLVSLVIGMLLVHRLVEQRQRSDVNIGLWNAVNSGNLADTRRMLDSGADPNTSEYNVLSYKYGVQWPALWSRLQVMMNNPVAPNAMLNAMR